MANREDDHYPSHGASALDAARAIDFSYPMEKRWSNFRLAVSLWNK
jgi:hypothetical protein